MLSAHNATLIRSTARSSRQSSALNLELVDPLLWNTVEMTNRSTWLQTEFSCSGLPDDHANDSEGSPRRWGSFTPGEMYIAYACPWAGVRRVLETAINQAANCKLTLAIRFSSWREGVSSRRKDAAHFAIAVNYEPTDPIRTQKALSVFDAIAAIAANRERSREKPASAKPTLE